MNFNEFPEYKNYIKFSDFARDYVGDQAQYVWPHLDGRRGYTNFSKGIEYHCFSNDLANHREIIIEKDSADELAKRILKERVETGNIGDDNEFYKKYFSSVKKADDEDLSTQQIKKVADNFIRFIMGDKEQAIKNLKILKIDYTKPESEEEYNKDYDKAFNNMVVFLKKHFV